MTKIGFGCSSFLSPRTSYQIHVNTAKEFDFKMIFLSLRIIGSIVLSR